MGTFSRGCRFSAAMLLLGFSAALGAVDHPEGGSEFRLPAEFTAEASEYLDARVRITGFSGAIVVAHDGQPILRNGYGQANREFDVPNTPGTKFRLGSVTKPFTAVAVLLLEERGKLKVTDRVSRHL